MKQIKPFTLKWWMHIYTRCTVKSTVFLYIYNKSLSENKQAKELATRYAAKAEWISDRIIKKYGE